MKRITKILILIALACSLGTAGTAAKNYTVLISAGRTTADDAFVNSEYWYDLFLAYKMMIETGYDHDDIFVLYGEGTDYNSIHERYQNPYPESITDYNNHKETIESVLAYLGEITSDIDHLYVWWLGHGDDVGQNLALFIENTSEMVMDYEFATYMEQIEHYELRIFSFMTCYSGGIIDDLEGLDSIVMTSSDFYHLSHSAYLCEAPHTEFHYHETCAFHWETPFQMCGLVDADENNDEKISFLEAFDYAAVGTTSPAQLSDQGDHAPYNYLANYGIHCAGYAVDDDNSGASQGNGNQLPEYGETIELTVTLENLSEEDLLDVYGVLATDDAYVTILSAEAGFGDIPGNGGTASNEPPFVLAISTDVPDQHGVLLELTLLEQPDPVMFTMQTYAPELTVVAFDVDDTVGGDGDGIPEPGEEVDVCVTVLNDGSVGIDEASAVLAGDPYLDPEPIILELGALGPGQTIVSGPVVVAIDVATPDIYYGTLTAILRGIRNYHRGRVLLFPVGDVFQDDMEDGSTWSHYAGGGGFEDEWHLEVYRNHTHNGQQSWKCGGPGASNYGNLLYAVLESSPFTLSENCFLSVWHWMDAETSQAHPGYCYDGGLVEISIDGGDWEVIDPEGGYPYLIRDGSTPGPFPADTPVLSGSHDWQQILFDLSGYAGSARVRFAFGSDGAAAAEGWYIDDVSLQGATFSGAEEMPGDRTIRLHPARPNPTAGRSQLQLELAVETNVDVRVHDAMGRAVCTILSGSLPAGRHTLTWNGFDGVGHPMGAGVYWIRAVMDGETERVCLVRVR